MNRCGLNSALDVAARQPGSNNDDFAWHRCQSHSETAVAGWYDKATEPSEGPESGYTGDEPTGLVLVTIESGQIG